MRILVLGGDDSPEREVSLRSAAAVAAAAKTAGFDVIEADPKDGLEILDNLPQNTLVFPILHGVGGEDGAIQAELEKRHLPYLGSDSRVSKKCFNKWLTRQILEAASVPMPKAALVNKETYGGSAIAKGPHVLKVLRGGSSIGTLLIRHPEKIDRQQIESIFELDSQAVLEELIDGPEITVPILDNIALTVIEIVPPAEEEFNYENKYNGRTQEICPPVSIPEGLQEQARQLAEKVHKLMGARHLSRVDIMIDKQHNLYVLEINTIPGLTDQSLYPKSAAVSGLSMPELVKKFAELVQRDFAAG